MNVSDAKPEKLSMLKKLTRDTVILQRMSIIFIFAVLVIAISLTTDRFLTVNNILNVLKQISVNGIISVGMTLVIITGGINIAVGPMIGITGVIVGSILVNATENVIYAIFASIIVCAIFGAICGFIISRFHVPPFIATLSMQTIIVGVAFIYSNGRPYIISNPVLLAFGKGSVGIIPIPAIIFVIVSLIGTFILNKTRFGRHILAVGGNPVAAKASGISNNRVLVIVYTLSGVFTAIAGIVLAARISSGLASSGSGYELDAIAATVIGGTSMTGGVGSVSGTVIGAMIIGVISNGLNLLNVNSYWQLIVKGLIIAIAVIMDINFRKKE